VIRFVDLTAAYWLEEGKPLCAFLNTVTDCFLENVEICHTFNCLEDVQALPISHRERCLALIPEGFFK